jgi:hypothetical protein
VAQVVCAALLTGAGAADQKRTAMAVAAAMRDLWESLARRLGNDLVDSIRSEMTTADLGSNGLESKSVEGCAERMQARLSALSVTALEEILVRAHAVLSMTDPSGMAVGRYTVAHDDVVERVAFGAGRPNALVTDPGRWLTPVGQSDPSVVSPSGESECARVEASLGHRSPNQIADIVRIEQQIVGDVERRLGPDHSDTIAARLSLAEVYRWAGRIGDAVETLERVIADRERLLGSEHPDTVTAGAKLRTWQEG